ncbi:MAG: hypothetical protein JWQ09_322 [Segetibacter sp.]|nr:hypothetical protein [Segetibacter sp.]
MNYINMYGLRLKRKMQSCRTLVAEQKLRTQRILGELIKDGQEKGE